MQLLLLTISAILLSITLPVNATSSLTAGKACTALLQSPTPPHAIRVIQLFPGFSKVSHITQPALIQGHAHQSHQHSISPNDLNVCLHTLDKILDNVSLYWMWRYGKPNHYELETFSHTSRVHHAISECIRHLRDTSPSSSSCNKLRELGLSDDIPRPRNPVIPDSISSSLSDINPRTDHWLQIWEQVRDSSQTLLPTLMTLIYMRWKRERIARIHEVSLNVNPLNAIADENVIKSYLNDVRQSGIKWSRYLIYNDLQAKNPTVSLSPYITRRMIGELESFLRYGKISPGCFTLQSLRKKEDIPILLNKENNLHRSDSLPFILARYEQSIHPSMYGVESMANLYSESPDKDPLFILLNAGWVEKEGIKSIQESIEQSKSLYPKDPYNLLISTIPFLLRFLLNAYGDADRMDNGHVGPEWNDVRNFLQTTDSLLKIVCHSASHEEKLVIRALGVSLSSLSELIMLPLDQVVDLKISELIDQTETIARTLSISLTSAVPKLHTGYILVGIILKSNGSPFRMSHTILPIVSDIYRLSTNLDLRKIILGKHSRSLPFYNTLAREALDSLHDFAKKRMRKMGIEDLSMRD